MDWNLFGILGSHAQVDKDRRKDNHRDEAGGKARAQRAGGDQRADLVNQVAYQFSGFERSIV